MLSRSSARLIGCLVLCLPAALGAQRPARSTQPWTLRLRAAMSGTSHGSEPAGYKIYSGITLEGAIERRLGDVTALDLSFRTESREVLGPAGVVADNRLGSLEMLPVTLLMRWIPSGGGRAPFQPYVGAGAALTGTWEKSGALDSSDVPLRLDPAIGLGADYELSPRVLMNLDVKWNSMKATIVNFRSPDPVVKIDPLTLGLGMGVRF